MPRPCEWVSSRRIRPSAESLGYGCKPRALTRRIRGIPRRRPLGAARLQLTQDN